MSFPSNSGVVRPLAPEKMRGLHLVAATVPAPQQFAALYLDADTPPQQQPVKTYTLELTPERAL